MKDATGFRLQDNRVRKDAARTAFPVSLVFFYKKEIALNYFPNPSVSEQVFIYKLRIRLWQCIVGVRMRRKIKYQGDDYDDDD